MKKNVIYGVIGGILLFLESIIASSLSTEIKINEPSTYVNLLKFPIFWITVFIIIGSQLFLFYKEKKDKKNRSGINLETKAARKQYTEITKTECINRLMKSATDKAISGNFYDAKQTMEILKNLDSILDAEVKEDGKNKR